MGTFVPPRTDPFTGRSIITTEDNYNDLMARYNASQSFQNSFGQGIPGLTAPRVPYPGPTQGMPQSALPVGRAPPPSFAGPANPMPPNQGPYGQQAMQLAGLLAPQQAQPGQPSPGDTYPAGLLGGKRPFRPVK